MKKKRGIERNDYSQMKESNQDKHGLPLMWRMEEEEKNGPRPNMDVIFLLRGGLIYVFGQQAK